MIEPKKGELRVGQSVLVAWHNPPPNDWQPGVITGIDADGEGVDVLVTFIDELGRRCHEHDRRFLRGIRPLQAALL